MAGESIVSQPDIEQRAQKLEEDQNNAAVEAEKKAADEKAAADKAEAEKKAAEGKKNDEPQGKRQPNDINELRKFATRASMEAAENRKAIEALTAAFNRSKVKQVDLKELAKDPAKLEKAIQEREKELIESYQTENQTKMNQATADLTTAIWNNRFYDMQGYPRWAELSSLMMELARPNEKQPSGDPRINFNQHPSQVLDELYDLAQKIVAADPNYKAPEKKETGKTYSQQEYDAALAKAKEEAIAEHDKALRNEQNGAGVGSQGKGASKGKPGEVNKDALWQMPLSSLGDLVKSATERLHG